jgi:hydroxypyruvate reductase
MNVVRKHLSAIKGGRLAAAAYPARCVTLLISDVPGDDPGTIASGPTVADPSTQAHARAIVERYGVALPEAARAVLAEPSHESPAPGDPRLARAEAHLIARPLASLEAAARAAREVGIGALILSDRLEGEAREVGTVHAGIALSVRDAGVPVPAPAVILSGGETTVTVRDGGGRGGRNSEFALALALDLDGARGVHAIACDTDGIDGSEDNAGVLVSPDLLARHPGGRAAAQDHLDRNDTWSFFAAADALVVTGPTLTNVNDFRAMLILGGT